MENGSTIASSVMEIDLDQLATHSGIAVAVPAFPAPAPASAPADASSAASASTSTTAGDVLLQSWQISYKDCAGISVTDRKMSAAEFAAHEAKRTSTRADVMAQLRASVAANGGKDQEPHVHAYPHPGQDEIDKSLASVVPGWEHVPPSELRNYLATGVAPLNVSQDTLARYRHAIQVAEKDVAMEADSEIARMLALLPESERAKLQRSLLDPSSTRSVKLIPNQWLAERMHVLKVRPSLRDKILFTLGRKAAILTAPVEQMWIEAVMLHNGFCKTVLELQQHVLYPFTVDGQGKVQIAATHLKQYCDARPGSEEEPLDKNLLAFYAHACQVRGLSDDSVEFQQKKIVMTTPVRGATTAEHMQHVSQMRAAMQTSEPHDGSQLHANQCAVCATVTDQACAGCRALHMAVTYYCSRACQKQHYKIHKPFCKTAHVYPVDLPRYCEGCGTRTTLGCQDCDTPYCGSTCYTQDHARHLRVCTLVKNTTDATVATETAADVISSFPLSNGEVAQIIAMPTSTTTSSRGSKNVFDFSTDQRATIRAAFTTQTNTPPPPPLAPAATPFASPVNSDSSGSGSGSGSTYDRFKRCALASDLKWIRHF